MVPLWIEFYPIEHFNVTQTQEQKKKQKSKNKSDKKMKTAATKIPYLMVNSLWINGVISLVFYSNSFLEFICKLTFTGLFQSKTWFRLIMKFNDHSTLTIIRTVTLHH